MKKLLVMSLLLLPIAGFSRTYRMYAGKTRLVVKMPSGWRKVRRRRNTSFTAVRSKEIFQIRILLVKDKYQEYIERHRYNLKRIANKTEHDRIIFIEGLKFREFVFIRKQNNKKTFMRYLITKNGNAALMFFYKSSDEAIFRRNMNQISLTVAKFVKNNFYK